MKRFQIILISLQLHFSNSVVREANELPFNYDHRLTENLVFFSDNDFCKRIVKTLFRSLDNNQLPFLKDLAVEVASPLYETLFSPYIDTYMNDNHDSQKPLCVLGSFYRGTPKAYLHHILPTKLYIVKGNEDYNITNARSWFSTECVMKEVGFVTQQYRYVDLYWVDFNGGKVFLGKLEKGDKNTFWQDSFIGKSILTI
jgi:hypothetical protein